jgi:uncharacterized protein
VADCVLQIKVVPRSSQRKAVLQDDGIVKVWVTQAPTEGQANEGVIKTLAEILKVAPSRIQIIKGETSRSKTVQLIGLDLDEALRLVRNEPQ